MNSRQKDGHFSLSYAAKQYEMMWLPGANLYEAYAKIMAQLIKLLNLLPPNSTAVEIGSGTGNSAAVFSEIIQMGKLIGIDPNLMMKLFEYKLLLTRGQKPQPPFDITDQKILANFERIAQMFPRNGDSVFPITGMGEKLPIKTESVNLVFAIQAMHWLAIAPNDGEGLSKEYFIQTLKEIRRVLEIGGHLLFDESGLQFKFENDLDNQHVLSHPLYILYEKKLHQLLANPYMLKSDDRFTEEEIEQLLTLGLSIHDLENIKNNGERKINRYHHFFSLQMIIECMMTANLALVDIDKTTLLKLQKIYPNFKLFLGPNGKYVIYTHNLGKVEVRNAFLEGGAMTHFSRPGLRELDSGLVARLLKKACELTEAEHKSSESIQAIQTSAIFLAKAI